ncbi:MAG: ABC transporter permease subunit [Anaerolineaceae bacterium]|nr:ABC transporter permease subunit [Anaerolineaceae bacterium]
MSTNSTFELVNEHGWRRGFANLFMRESAMWWRSRRWWINLLIWLVLINGTLLAMLSSASEAEHMNLMTPEQILAEARTVLGVMAGMFGAIGVVIATQGAIIDEKKSGIAAWIMSKPASRPAFILSKLIANGLALLVIIVVVQGVVAYLQLANYSGSPPALGPFVAGMALIALHMLFYLTLTLMLGTLFSDRGPVIGIPIGILFSAMFLMGYVGQFAYLMPWMIIPAGSFQGLAIDAMLGQPLATTTPIWATIVWIIVFVTIAIWRFTREEF